MKNLTLMFVKMFVAIVICVVLNNIFERYNIPINAYGLLIGYLFARNEILKRIINEEQRN